jgi:hypothetical protein
MAEKRGGGVGGVKKLPGQLGRNPPATAATPSPPACVTSGPLSNLGTPHLTVSAPSCLRKKFSPESELYIVNFRPSAFLKLCKDKFVLEEVN